VKLEQGHDRMFSAGFAYTSTAFPMLTGTLITVAGFLPIALAQSATGEYTRALFEVSAIALLASWVASVIVVPYVGYRLILEAGQRGDGRWGGWLRRRVPGWRRLVPGPGARADRSEHEVYATPFYRRLRALISGCVRYRKTVLTGTAVIFL